MSAKLAFFKDNKVMYLKIYQKILFAWAIKVTCKYQT